MKCVYCIRNKKNEKERDRGNLWAYSHSSMQCIATSKKSEAKEEKKGSLNDRSYEI